MKLTWLVLLLARFRNEIDVPSTSLLPTPRNVLRALSVASSEFVYTDKKFVSDH